MSSGSFIQFRLDLLDPRHGQGGGAAGDLPRYPDGSVDEGRAWARAVGSAQDRELVLLRTAALARLPQYTPDDALDQLGQGGFVLERFPDEGDDTYRARLEAAFNTYRLGGTAAGVIASLRAYGFVDVLVLPIWQSPAPIAPATAYTSYSEFYVFLGPGFGTTGILPLILGSAWNLGISGSGLTLGSTMTRAQIIATKRQILRWKAAHGYPVKVFLLFGAQTTADAPALTAYPIGRTIGDTLPALGDAGCILGGYQI